MSVETLSAAPWYSDVDPRQGRCSGAEVRVAQLTYHALPWAPLATGKVPRRHSHPFFDLGPARAAHMATRAALNPGPRSFLQRALDGLERWGNRLPDPAILFVFGLLLVWGLSALLSGVEFAELDPRTRSEASPEGTPIRVQSLLTGQALVAFLTGMVKTFTGFHPLGVVLVTLLGVGVAEYSGFINACLKGMLSVTPKQLLTPMLIFVALISHTAADAGYVLVIPLGAVIFYAAGRHPLAGIAAAFAGVSGGFSANVLVSGIDPLLAGLTTTGAQIIDPGRTVNALCNFYFTASSSVLIVLAGWFITDRVVEPRLRATAVDGDPNEMPKMEALTESERRGMLAGLLTALVGLVVVAVCAAPLDSPFRGAAPDRSLTLPFKDANGKDVNAPLMDAIVPLIFLLFLAPGIVHGYVSGKFKTHRDIVKGMSLAMGTMAYYLVMAFCAALFIDAFAKSNIGLLVAIKGANFLRDMAAPNTVTLVGIILLTASVNLLIGSASAKWAMLAPIFVPMLMQLGVSPELTQAAFRVGDSTTNIITPMMPYFPLVVVFAQRYVKGTGIGTLIALMLPYSITFLVLWTTYLLIYWQLGIPLFADVPYTYPAP
jgi:aminobenzoyl-glutamate transport protein